MPQSHSAVYLHAVFATKSRVPFFKNKEFREQVHAYLAGISKKLDCPAIIVGGVEDHVHILARHGRTISQADWVKEMKRASTIWLKEDPAYRDFGWQTGYGMFSVSLSKLAKVRKYIEDQEERHQKQSFQDEFRAMLRKHGVEWDEKYVWD